MHLVGVDIGFSERRRSNGFAVLRDGCLLRAERLSVAERNQALRSLEEVDIVAIDAPLLPAGTPDSLVRRCERVFSRGAFQKRCKPGMSHIAGTGRTLRAHGQRSVQTLIDARALGPMDRSLPCVWPEANIFEAFPNAFLGVALPEEDFVPAPKVKRGGKFDWLYGRWIHHGLFQKAVAAAHLPELIAARCENEKDHDIRAALVCLLTAAFIAIDEYATVGDASGGYFFLPPASLWASWARDQVART